MVDGIDRAFDPDAAGALGGFRVVRPTPAALAATSPYHHKNDLLRAVSAVWSPVVSLSFSLSLFLSFSRSLFRCFFCFSVSLSLLA